MTVHVGVNMLWLVPGVVGGSEEYTTRLVAAMADHPSDDIDLTLFVLRPFVDTYPDLAGAFPTVVCPISGSLKAVRIAAEATWLAVQARRHRVDVLHHAGGTLPLLRASPSLLTIHDLQPLLMPDNFSRIKQAYLRWRLPGSARKARLVITLTHYTRRTIVEELHVPEERIDVVPPGYTASLAEQPVGDPRRTYDLTGPFFLFPAITYPHKNHQLLLKAMTKVLAERPDALLVFTHRAAQMEPTLTELADSLGVAHAVRRLGHIDRGDLNWLYRNAVALTFPSKFEGFGLPVLEAMGNGCPVIVSDVAALPEVVGECGVLLDPDDAGAWAAAMLELLSDADRRQWLVEASLSRITQFRWPASATELERVYRRAASLDG